jgi:hypothetical protein
VERRAMLPVLSEVFALLGALVRMCLFSGVSTPFEALFSA